MATFPEISVVHPCIARHERRYSLFSVDGREEEFLYYSHAGLPLRSLMFGNHFLDQLPGLMGMEDLCIECGLGLSVTGGVAQDGADLIAWGCTVEEANEILAALKMSLGEDGQWIVLF
jgi:hypothetical protein